MSSVTIVNYDVNPVECKTKFLRKDLDQSLCHWHVKTVISLVELFIILRLEFVMMVKLDDFRAPHERIRYGASDLCLEPFIDSIYLIYLFFVGYICLDQDFFVRESSEF